MSNRIRELRKQKNLTMKQLGEHLGIAENVVSRYETGKRQPDNETLLKFSKFFGVSVDYLLGAEDTIIGSKQILTDDQSIDLQFFTSERKEASNIIRDLPEEEIAALLPILRSVREKHNRE